MDEFSTPVHGESSSSHSDSLEKAEANEFEAAMHSSGEMSYSANVQCFRGRGGD